MSAALNETEKFPDLDSNVDAQEQDYLRHYNRSPHPYFRHGSTLQKEEQHKEKKHHTGASVIKNGHSHKGSRSSEDERWPRKSGQSSVTGSESGTEADDERPTFVRALPPPDLRPRKGLKTGEEFEDGGLTPLLTPSQLDDEGRHLSREYFDRIQAEDEEEAKAAQDKIRRRRLAEFLRRSSEVGLMGIILVCVLCGRDVLGTAWKLRYSILSHLITTAVLVLSYPVKLSFLESGTRYNKPWQRFRVPASFDPATILYPTFLPFLISLSLGRTCSSMILPNLILGLASLPQRLFPRSSRIDGLNTVHWLLSIIPLLVAQRTPWLTSALSKSSGGHYVRSERAEYLVSLYPLHYALLQPLHYLTTTSLLISELHLLSAGLINLLFLAQSPQAVILKACLWIGGVMLFVVAKRVLHWNLTLARIPKWKLRRPGHPKQERRSIVDSVKQLINVRRSAAAFQLGQAGEESDADEDLPASTIKEVHKGTPTLNTSMRSLATLTMTRSLEPVSAVESSRPANGWFPEAISLAGRQRRNTLAEGQNPELKHSRDASQRRGKPSQLLWCLRLTPAQAQERKVLYATFVYLAIAVIILGPVRSYVAKRALYSLEPIGWAVGYLFGDIPYVTSIVRQIGLDRWILVSESSLDWHMIAWTVPFDIDEARHIVGPSNTRLLIIAYLLFVLSLGLLTVFSLTSYVEVDTRRKVFHGVMVAMLIPSTFVDPCFCALALSLILTIFLLLEVIRAGQVPPVGNAIGRFIAPYVDGRDLRGPVVVSHIFLLIGSAIPLWLSLAAYGRKPLQESGMWPGWEVEGNKRDVGMLAGVICVGMGDAAASLIGRRYGRRKWMWIGGKSLEGSAAFAVAVTIGLMLAKAWLWFGGWQDASLRPGLQLADLSHLQLARFWFKTLAKSVFCACAASFMEAVLTGANDNVVVPVALWLLVKGARL